MGFRSLSFILQAYLKPTSKPAIVLPCLVPNLIKRSLCLDEFSSKMKEPDVPVWGKEREIRRQRMKGGAQVLHQAHGCAGIEPRVPYPVV